MVWLTNVPGTAGKPAGRLLKLTAHQGRKEQDNEIRTMETKTIGKVVK